MLTNRVIHKKTRSRTRATRVIISLNFTFLVKVCVEISSPIPFSPPLFPPSFGEIGHHHPCTRLNGVIIFSISRERERGWKFREREREKEAGYATRVELGNNFWFNSSFYFLIYSRKFHGKPFPLARLTRTGFRLTLDIKCVHLWWYC